MAVEKKPWLFIAVTWIEPVILVIGLVLIWWTIRSVRGDDVEPPKETKENLDHIERSAEILASAPHIDLIYDLPRSDVVGRLMRDQQIKVVNTTDYIAYDVQIQGHWSRHVRPDVEAICWKIRVDAALHDAHLVVSHKLRDLGFVFVGDCYHDETFVPVLLLQAIKARHFLAARRTPRGPEVQHHNLAPVLG